MNKNVATLSLVGKLFKFIKICLNLNRWNKPIDKIVKNPILSEK